MRAVVLEERRSGDDKHAYFTYETAFYDIYDRTMGEILDDIFYQPQDTGKISPDIASLSPEKGSQ